MTTRPRGAPPRAIAQARPRPESPAAELQIRTFFGTLARIEERAGQAVPAPAPGQSPPEKRQ